MMETYAANLYVGAIEEEAAVRAEDEAADPEWRRVIVADRGPALHARNGAIHVGPFERPKVGVQYLELLRHVSDRAVRQFADVMAVDPDLTVSIYPVEFDENEPVAVALRDSKGLAVPAQAAGERAAARSGGIPRAELALDAPVVRQVQRSPARIVQG